LGYCCHRPSEYYGPHVSLFERAFFEFEKEVKSLSLEEEGIVQQDAEFVLNLCNKMSEHISDEKSRVDAFNTMLSQYISKEVKPLVINRSTQSNVTTDAGLETSIPNVKANGLLFSLKAKPEIGKGSCCAYMEGIHYHGIFAAKESLQELVKTSCLPSFFCILAGPYFQVFGTIFLDNLHVDPLTPMYPLFVLPHDRNMMLQLVRCFKALKNGLKRLENSYEQPPQKFPWFDNKKSFNYVKQLSSTKQIWLAKNAQGDYIVKFSELFCEEAHIACAKKGLAPTLHYHSQLDRFKVAVMSFISGNCLLPEFISSLETKVKQQLFNKVRNAISQMHDLNIVHGDLRGPNIIESNDGKIYFIDFDFAGVFGKARYPPFLNSNIPWAKGVEAGKLIDKEHDYFWLNQQT